MLFAEKGSLRLRPTLSLRAEARVNADEFTL
jgi:hypothetical protein